MKTITIGRHPDNNVVINDPIVGRHHLQITQHDDGHFSVLDLNSKNGTYINGKRVYGEVRLSPNDKIQIGRTTLLWQNYFASSFLDRKKIFKTKNRKLPKLIGVISGAIVITITILLLLLLGENNPNKYRTKEEPQSIAYAPRRYTDSSNSNSKVKEAGDLSRESKYRVAFEDNNHANHPQYSTAEICRDLVGHTLSEGTENGYYSRDWKWIIEEGEISDFQILSIRENTSNRYTIDVQMRLSSNTCAYDATATIYYVKSQHGWKIELVKSLGMHIVRTYRYDDCIQIITDEGWMFGKGLKLVNNCEITLEVGGRIYKQYSGWQKFSIVVPPHSTGVASDQIDDYAIDYIERI